MSLTSFLIRSRSALIVARSGWVFFSSLSWAATGDAGATARAAPNTADITSWRVGSAGIGVSPGANVGVAGTTGSPPGSAKLGGGNSTVAGGAGGPLGLTLSRGSVGRKLKPGWATGADHAGSADCTGRA